MYRYLETSRLKTSLQLCLLVSVGFLFVGCGEGAKEETVQVTGMVTYNGKPLEKVKVTFMPDPSEGNTGSQSAWGETNSEGRYELSYESRGEKAMGAPVGVHKVVLYDLKQNDSRSNDDAKPKPTRGRFSSKLSSASTTSLIAKVEPGGPVSIDLKADGK